MANLEAEAFGCANERKIGVTVPQKKKALATRINENRGASRARPQLRHSFRLNHIHSLIPVYYNVDSEHCKKKSMATSYSLRGLRTCLDANPGQLFISFGCFHHPDNTFDVGSGHTSVFRDAGLSRLKFSSVRAASVKVLKDTASPLLSAVRFPSMSSHCMA